MDPSQLLYAKTHEWAFVEEQDGGKVATVGISAFAIEALTDLVYLELPKVGAQVTAGQPFGEIESVKAVSDVYAPVSGEVIAVNEELPNKLESLNDDPYIGGWIAKIKITDESGLANLLDQSAYEKQCQEEG
ncbi:glycine cleavage system protein GcvH [Blastopirellula sp. JC732]|uniref:Glycine cleavage system H protein n=1 Tax=Blastopirellula sediminis TaxID=2894196 RepID=A0A9X1SH78_9BACT|nr:glycine cleavage system protein GcvH [Blastopirellula sediminis]MCC9605790.1 glycine cleavage system protein GcvH [Blastopirellula sediminis]MCC9630910.1 glycine cleavage system protein GcvH [Blastopirellula sediminis]